MLCVRQNLGCSDCHTRYRLCTRVLNARLSKVCAPHPLEKHVPRPSEIVWKVLVRLCDHIVVWAAQGLVRAAVAGHPPLDQGQLLRLGACRDTLAEALRTCSAGRGGSGDGGAPGEAGGGAGGGMYERRLGFLDDLLELLRAPSSELEGGVLFFIGSFFLGGRGGGCRCNERIAAVLAKSLYALCGC